MLRHRLLRLLADATTPTTGIDLCQAVDGERIGIVYGCLCGLEEAGYLTSAWELRERRAERGFNRARVYTITDAGRRYLQELDAAGHRPTFGAIG